MQSSLQYPLMGEIDVDEAFIGGKEEGHQGRGNESKSTIVFAIEKTKNDDGIKRAYAMKIDNTSSEELSKIFHQHIDPKAHITTDKWTGYMPLVKEWDITQIKSKGGENFQLMHRLIQGVKSWIRGIYHKVSPKYLQAYLDEYCYRFNRNIFKDSIFDNLIQRMIHAKPKPYKSFFEAISS
jgi:transposase-like protein